MRRRGFALLIVLWTLVPVSVLFLTLATVARSDSHLTFNLRDAARLQAAADGGINTAIFGLLRDHTDAPLRLKLGDAAISVRITSLAGLVNPNDAATDLLRAMLVRAGADPDQATRIAFAIAIWRTPAQTPQQTAANAAYRAAGLDYGPPGAPFESLDELRQVLGMTPALFAALRPNLTLFNDRTPDPALAPAMVRAALADLGVSTRSAGVSARQAGPGTVFRIDADARSPDGATVTRTAIVRLGPAAAGRPWTILTLAPGRDLPASASKAEP